MKLNNLVSYFLKIFIFITFFLARTFTGFYIFGFRVGELIIGFTLLCLLGYLIFNKQINFLKERERKVQILNNGSSATKIIGWAVDLKQEQRGIALLPCT